MMKISEITASIIEFLNNNLRLEINNLIFQEMRPIHWACNEGHLQIVKYFVKLKCNIECEDQLVNNHCRFEINYFSFQKRRLIHFVSKSGHLEMLMFLLENNCNIECEDVEVNGYWIF